jgi:hypothetical protein
MKKRTIKPAAGMSHITAAAATSAARVVYRDGPTGRFVLVHESDGLRVGKVRDKASSGAGIFRRVRGDSRSVGVNGSRGDRASSRTGSKKR